jgi:hypothetical protein
MGAARVVRGEPPPLVFDEFAVERLGLGCLALGQQRLAQAAQRPAPLDVVEVRRRTKVSGTVQPICLNGS